MSVNTAVKTALVRLFHTRYGVCPRTDDINTRSQILQILNQHETLGPLSAAAIWGCVVGRAVNDVANDRFSFIFKKSKNERPLQTWGTTRSMTHHSHPNLRHTYECFHQIPKLHVLCDSSHGTLAHRTLQFKPSALLLYSDFSPKDRGVTILRQEGAQ